MAPMLPDRFDATPRKCIAAPDTNNRKDLASRECLQTFGRAIAVALDYAQLTQQEAAFRMGYRDQSALSRWIAGSENPNLSKLWMLGDSFQQGIVIALASAIPNGVHVRTVVTLDQRRSA